MQNTYKNKSRASGAGRRLALLDYKEQLFNLFDIGFPCEEVAKIYNVNPNTVYRFRRRFYLNKTFTDK